MNWLQSEGYSKHWKRNIVYYLNRYVTVIKEPLDIIKMFSEIDGGKRHVVLALRTLFNFYEVMGIEKGYADILRKALPKVKCGIDLKIPSEAEIVESLKKLGKAPLKYQALYNALLDSGLHLVEGIELINNFREAEAVNGFYRCELAMFRGKKQAYYAHFTERTLNLMKQVEEKLDERSASRYLGKYGFVRPKYLRKFAFDKMIELEVPESFADFNEGRVPKMVGGKHYMALARQASKFYPRYAEYIEKSSLFASLK
jgi:intergrase/recombinase